MGIGIIHQELNMMEHLTVAENIFIGREFTQRNGISSISASKIGEPKNFLHGSR